MGDQTKPLAGIRVSNWAKSVTLNLRLPEAQEIARRLAKMADVVIENFRPGMPEK